MRRRRRLSFSANTIRATCGMSWATPKNRGWRGFSSTQRIWDWSRRRMICDTSVEKADRLVAARTPLPRDLEAIQDQVLDGQRITPENALRLYRALTVPELGALADAVRQRKRPGNIVTYIID